MPEPVRSPGGRFQTVPVAGLLCLAGASGCKAAGWIEPSVLLYRGAEAFFIVYFAFSLLRLAIWLRRRGR